MNKKKQQKFLDDINSKLEELREKRAIIAKDRSLINTQKVEAGAKITEEMDYWREKLIEISKAPTQKEKLKNKFGEIVKFIKDYIDDMAFYFKPRKTPDLSRIIILPHSIRFYLNHNDNVIPVKDINLLLDERYRASGLYVFAKWATLFNEKKAIRYIDKAVKIYSKNSSYEEMYSFLREAVLELRNLENSKDDFSGKKLRQHSREEFRSDDLLALEAIEELNRFKIPVLVANSAIVALPKLLTSMSNEDLFLVVYSNSVWEYKKMDNKIISREIKDLSSIERNLVLIDDAIMTGNVASKKISFLKSKGFKHEIYMRAQYLGEDVISRKYLPPRSSVDRE